MKGEKTNVIGLQSRVPRFDSGLSLHIKSVVNQTLKALFGAFFVLAKLRKSQLKTA